MPRLRTLLLNRQPIRDDITNAGLAHIARLPALTRLELQGNCTITAAGVCRAVPGHAHVLLLHYLPVLTGLETWRVQACSSCRA